MKLGIPSRGETKMEGYHGGQDGPPKEHEGGTSMNEIGARRRKSETWQERGFRAFAEVPVGTTGTGADFIRRIEAIMGAPFPGKSQANFIQQSQRKGYLKKTGDAIEGTKPKDKGHFYPEYERVPSRDKP